ncbi:hypothetical protein JZ751_016526 [Albula glossodonta]|uniref:Lysine-specific demethylase 4-like Tudor domain-containing protein n=1 Tax=Albula glossodonta TaxID=121402 RepID=A0A8T2NYM0_9TELE|nr:hypothetical protein JZ751_016526 [Albula glossodonta]
MACTAPRAMPMCLGEMQNMLPVDPDSRDCVCLGPPEVGEAVQVKWPDGLFYGAKYLGSNTSFMYQSTASSMRFQDAFHIPMIQGEAKRQRMPNSRFQKDYVANLGCRSSSKSTLRNLDR